MSLFEKLKSIIRSSETWMEVQDVPGQEALCLLHSYNLTLDAFSCHISSVLFETCAAILIFDIFFVGLKVLENN